jgi:hypothetical protein
MNRSELGARRIEASLTSPHERETGDRILGGAIGLQSGFIEYFAKLRGRDRIRFCARAGIPGAAITTISAPSVREPRKSPDSVWTFGPLAVGSQCPSL